MQKQTAIDKALLVFNKIKTADFATFGMQNRLFSMVRATGLEPARSRGGT